MLLDNDIKEHLALAYVYAVASRAGCSTELIRVDRNSVDITVKHIDPTAGPDQVREGVIDLQVKAYVHDPPPGPSFAFSVHCPHELPDELPGSHFGRRTAHGRQRYVSVRGRLMRAGRTYVLEDPKDLRVIE